MHLLLINRHAHESMPLQQRLAAEGMTLDLARTPLDARAMMTAMRYDLALVDLSHNDHTGRALVLERERCSRIPIIALMPTATLTQGERHLVQHADDWMPKPIAIPELITRIRAVHARKARATTPAFAAAGLAISPETHQASFYDRPLHLSAREIDVLALLIRRAGYPVPRTTLEAAAYGTGVQRSANAIEAVLSRLRRTLRAAGCPVRIDAVRGVGWRLVIPDNRRGVVK